MSKKIKTLTPRIYEHSDFFHDAVDFAREHSLNTNELCLELSHYLVDNFEKIWKVEKPRVYKQIADLEAKLAESESRFQAHKQNDTRIIQDQGDLIDQLRQQLAEQEEEIESLKASSDKNIDYLIEFASLIDNENDCNKMLKALDRVKKGKKYIVDKDNQIKEMNLRRERLKTLLYNAIVLLEEHCGAVINTDLESELGITQEEYDEIMG